MPEDPIAHGELAALTRRHEQAQDQNVREFGIIKSELTTLQLKVSNLDQKVDNLSGQMSGMDQRLNGLDQKVEALDQKIDRNQAQIIELLTQLVGRRPDAG
ncbi:hypothetical protein [Streptomyces katrae]|uniref:hypothetical protein n=1 Tax=Streptomyces katrae TaxID=68223 RepID=UPI0004BEB5BF|nr:hypothetical protein [Streptomyces katrae]